MCADFKYYLSRQGPKGEPGAKGEKGDNGNTPTFSDGINTPTVYTMQIDMGDGNVFETQNLKYPMRDDGGNYLRYDRTNSTVTLSAPNIADLQRTSGEVTLASVSDVENEDAQDADAVSIELRNADQLALSNEINRINRDIDTVDTKVDGEIQNRQNADTALGGRIDGLDSSKADKTDVYTKAQTDALLSGKANTVHTHNLSQITDAGSLAGKNTVNYNTEVTNKPTIGNGTITITQGGVTKGTFTTNQSGNNTIELDAGGGGGATYTEGPGITINQNNEISANVDNNTIVIDGNSLKANIPDVSNFVTNSSLATTLQSYPTNTQLANTLESYPTNNALSNAITYQTVSVPTPATYTFDRIMNLNIWEYSTNPSVETGGGWTKIGTSTYTRNNQLVIPSDSSYNNGLWVTLFNLQDTECVKCNSGYTFSFECNPQITISYYSPEDGDTLITQQITINTPTNEVFNISSSSYGYTSLNIGVLKNIYIKSLMVQYSYDGNGHTPSVFLTPLYNNNGEVEVYTRSEGTPTTTTKAVIASTAVDGTTIDVDNNGKLTYVGTTGDTLPSQTGNSGKFLTTDGSVTSWATVSQPDLSQYYTKSQTNSLLDGKISTNIVQSPLEYTPENVPTYVGSITPSSPSINWYQTYIYGTNYYLNTFGPAGVLNTVTTPTELMSYVFNNAIKVNIQDPKNIAFTYTHELQTAGQYSGAVGSVVVGYEENNVFVPVYGTTNTAQYGGSVCFFTINSLINSNNSEYYGFYYNGDSYSNVAIQISGNTVKLSRFHSTGGESGTVTISNDTLNEINKCNIAYFSLQGKSGTVYENITNYKLCNPTDIMYNMTYAERYAAFSSADDLLYTQIEALSLKYDSTTLGVNASNELTVPTATSNTLGLVKPDGSTITVNNGVISAASSTPSNMVTTDTTQNITGVKSFTNNYSAALIAQAEYGIMVSTNMSDHYSGYGVNLNKYGVDIRGQNNLGQITISSNSTLGQTAYLFTIKQASNKTKFIHDDYLSDKKIYRDNNATNFLLEKDMLDGTYLKWDSTTNKITVDIQAIKDAIDALNGSDSAGEANFGGGSLNPGGWE